MYQYRNVNLYLLTKRVETYKVILTGEMMINLLLDEAYFKKEDILVRFNKEVDHYVNLFDLVEMIASGEAHAKFSYNEEIIDSVEKLIPVLNEKLDDVENMLMQDILIINQDLGLGTIGIIPFNKLSFEDKCQAIGVDSYPSNRNVCDLAHYYETLKTMDKYK